MTDNLTGETTHFIKTGKVYRVLATRIAVLPNDWREKRRGRLLHKPEELVLVGQELPENLKELTLRGMGVLKV